MNYCQIVFPNASKQFLSFQSSFKCACVPTSYPCHLNIVEQHFLYFHLDRTYAKGTRTTFARLCTCLCQSVGWFYDARQEVRTFLITCWSFCTLSYLAAVMLLTGKKQIHFLLVGVCFSCCFYFPHLWNTKCNFIDRHFLHLPSIWILCIKYSATHTCMISISFHFVVGNRCVGV